MKSCSSRDFRSLLIPTPARSPQLVRPKFSSSRPIDSVNLFPIHTKKNYCINESFHSDHDDSFMPKSKEISNFLSTARKLEFNSRCATAIPNVVEKRHTDEHTKDFVFEYVGSRSAVEKAIMIQRAFRRYRQKMSWRKIYQKNSRKNKEFAKIIFNSWRICITNRIEVIKTCYLRIKNSKCRATFMENNYFTPFKLFYITNCLLFPSRNKAETIYKFVRMFHSHLENDMFLIWKENAKFAKKQRSKTSKFHFSLKKQSKLNPVFKCFQIWLKFSQWSKKSKYDQQSKFISIRSSEVNILWRVIETKLNAKRSHIQRANERYLISIKGRATRALRNLCINTISDYNSRNTADVYRQRHLQRIAHIAWLRFVQIRNKERQTKREVIRNWYEAAYNYAQRKMIMGIISTSQQTYKNQKIMNKWFKLAKVGKIRRIREQLLIYQNLPIAYMSIFSLLKLDDLFFHVKCWRAWLKYIQMRKKWRVFNTWSENMDKEKEEQHMIICEMKRMKSELSHRSLYNTEDIKIKRYLGHSIEITIKELSKQTRDIEKSQKLHWKFETESFKKVNIDYKSDALARCLALRVHQLKPYDLCKLGIEKPVVEDNENPLFVKNRTIEELEAQIIKNGDIIRQRTRFKLMRDFSILAGFISHINAVRFKEFLPQFSTEDESHVLQFERVQITDEMIKVYPEIRESTNLLLDEALKITERIKTTYAKEKMRTLLKFNSRLRSPNFLDDIVIAQTGRESIRKEDTTDLRSTSVESFYSADYTPPQINQLNTFFFEDDYFRKTFSRISDVDDLKGSMRRFFNTTNKVNLDMIQYFAIDKPTTIYRRVEQSIRHRTMKNIFAFLNEINGTKANSPVPKLLEAPEWAKIFISASISLHKDLMETNLAQYLNETAFSQLIHIDDRVLIETRTKTWNALKKRFGFEIPSSFVSGKKQQFVPSSFSGFNLFSSRSSSRSCDEKMNESDAYLVCFILPHVIPMESLLDFISDEIIKSKQEDY